MHGLDIKFQERYDAINKRRTAILNGSYEPSGAEVNLDNVKKEIDVMLCVMVGACKGFRIHGAITFSGHVKKVFRLNSLAPQLISY